jgi:hypothetical protein
MFISSIEHEAAVKWVTLVKRFGILAPPASLIAFLIRAITALLADPSAARYLDLYLDRIAFRGGVTQVGFMLTGL